MRKQTWLTAVLAALILAGCAGMPTDPDAAARAALAPTGKLRVAFFSAPIYGLKDKSTGELKGLGVDLGRQLADKLGVPFEAHPYRNLAALIESVKSGEWDIGLTTIDEKRAALMDFTRPYLEVEQGFLVRAGLPAATMADVDKAGVRVGVVKKSASALHLAKTLKATTPVELGSLADLREAIVSGKVDAIAIGKPFLYATAAKLPGSRVLDGAIIVDPVAMGVVKGRDPAGLAYANRFVDEVRAAGTVKTAIEQYKLKGVRAVAAK